MKDPRRLHELDHDTVGTLLLRAGRADEPSRAWLERTLAGVGAAGTTFAAQGAAAGAGASALPAAIVVKWIGLGALGGVVLTGAYSLAVSDAGRPVDVPAGATSGASHAREPRDGPASVERSLAALPVPEAPSAAPARSPSQARDAAPSTSSVAFPQPGPAQAAPASVAAFAVPETAGSAAGPATPARDPSTLGEQALALKAAKSALDRGAFMEALRLVNAYRARFPRRDLEPEAAYIEMESELALGNTARARELARRIAGSSTPNAQRARKVVEGGTP